MNYSFFIFHVFLLNADKIQWENHLQVSCTRNKNSKKLTKRSISCAPAGGIIIIILGSYLVADVSTLIQFKLHIYLLWRMPRLNETFIDGNIVRPMGDKTKLHFREYIGQARNSLNDQLASSPKTIFGACSGGDFISPATKGIHIFIL